MTENKIFEILLPKHYDFPKLHEEAASTIATNFTDIIYDTLKVKSSSATTKRLNILSFLKSLTSKPENHINVNQDNYEIFVKSCLSQFTNDSFQDYITELEQELQEKLPKDICSEIGEFYRRKNEKHQKNIKKLELMKKCDQEALDRAKFPAKVTRNISYYETSENIIKNLLDSNSSNHQTETNITDFKYRKKQIQFAYSLLYLRQWDSLLKILKRFTKYKQLTSLEKDFLHYLNENLNNNSEIIQDYLTKHFIFIYEKIIIDFCTKIIQYETQDINDFFETLLFNKQFVIIKKLCNSETFKLKLRSLLFELYTYSYCNNNLFKFINFIL